jgi:hypothetical protein
MVEHFFVGIGSPHRNNLDIPQHSIAKKERVEVSEAKAEGLTSRFSALPEKSAKPFAGNTAGTSTVPALCVIPGINRAVCFSITRY